MTNKMILAAVLASATAIAPVAYAASNMSDTTKADSSSSGKTTSSKSASNGETGADKTVDRDFTKLSKDGFTAFRNLRLARLAIFDGRTDEAQKLVKQAQGSLDKASKDDTAFLKAASDITPPKRMTEGAQEKSTDTTPVKWLPIDGQMALTEAYAVTPENAAAIGKANQSLKNGDRKGAMDTLKLAGIDMDYVMALVPLEATTDTVDQAASDLKDGKYYEANLDLKKAEDGVVYDSIDVVGSPAAKASKTSDNSSSGNSSASGKNAQTTESALNSSSSDSSSTPSTTSN